MSDPQGFPQVLRTSVEGAPQMGGEGLSQNIGEAWG